MAGGLTQAQIVERIERLEAAVNALVEELAEDSEDADAAEPPADEDAQTNTSSA